MFADVVWCRIASKQEISYFRDATLENVSLVLCSDPSTIGVYGQFLPVVINSMAQRCLSLWISVLRLEQIDFSFGSGCFLMSRCFRFTSSDKVSEIRQG